MIYLFFFMKTYVIGTRLKQLCASNEYHNICFHEELRKMSVLSSSYRSEANDLNARVDHVA